MEKELDFVKFLKFSQKRVWIIILFLIAGVGLSYLFETYLYESQYRSSTQIVVNQRSGEGTNTQIMNTYVEMLKSPAILSHVQENLELPVTVDQLMTNITVTNPQNTQVLSASYVSDNPYEAAEITNTIADSFKFIIENIMNRDEEILITFYAVPNLSPVSYSSFTIMVIGSLIGLMLGVLLIGVQFLLYSPEDSETKGNNEEEQLINNTSINVGTSPHVLHK